MSTGEKTSSEGRSFISELELETNLEKLFAKFQSPHYFSSIKVSHSRSIKITTCHEEEEEEEEEERSSASSASCKTSARSRSSTSCKERETLSGSTVSTVSLRVDVSYHSIVEADPWYHRFAEVGKVSAPSLLKPIAPDG